MTDAPTTIDVTEAIAPIRGKQAETDSFVAEQRRLIAESEARATCEAQGVYWQMTAALAAGALLFAAGAGFMKLISG